MTFTIDGVNAFDHGGVKVEIQRCIVLLDVVASGFGNRDDTISLKNPRERNLGHTTAVRVGEYADHWNVENSTAMSGEYATIWVSWRRAFETSSGWGNSGCNSIW